MALVVFHTRRVRHALRQPVNLGVDLLLLGAVGAILGAIISFGREVAAPYQPQVVISLSLWALPKYTLFSLARGFAGGRVARGPSGYEGAFTGAHRPLRNRASCPRGQLAIKDGGRLLQRFQQT